MNQHTPWRLVALLALALTVGVSVVVLAFTWPSVTSSPRNIPVSISGPEKQIEIVSEAIDDQADGRLVLTSVDSRAQAVELIEERTTLGAIVLGDNPEVLVTSAGSPIVSQLLTGVAGQLEKSANEAAAAQAAAVGAQAPHVTVAVTDIVPLAATDERGAGMTSAAFPLVIAGFMGGLLISLAIRGAARRLAALGIYSIAVGAALAGVLQPFLGVLQGSFVANAGLISLLVASMASVIVGMHATLGQRGLPIAIVTIMLIANPIAAATQPLQFLPQPWGLVGQWFPPGAGATLLRDLSYFPGAASIGFTLSVLVVWTVVGVVLTALGLHARRTRTVAK